MPKVSLAEGERDTAFCAGFSIDDARLKYGQEKTPMVQVYIDPAALDLSNDQYFMACVGAIVTPDGFPPWAIASVWYQWEGEWRCWHRWLRGWGRCRRR